MNLKGVDKATWTRIISLFLVLANQISVSIFDFKIIPFGDDEINEGVSIGLSIAVTFWATWKNNSFTTKAQEADKQLKESA